MDVVHYLACPGYGNPDTTHCVCEVIEDEEIARASRPSPADLLRKAKEKGLVQPAANAYF